MLDSGRNFVLGLLLLLGAGALIGWLNGRADSGLLVAALLGLGWQPLQERTSQTAQGDSQIGQRNARWRRNQNTRSTQ